jgi:hypothetical protein
MSWATVQEAVRLAIAKSLRMEDYLGGDGVTYVRRVEWSNRETAARWASEGWADLDLTAIRVKGTDETRYDFEDGGTPEDSRLVPTTGGQRYFTVSVKVAIDSQDPAEASPGFLCGRLRTRIRHQSTIEDLLEAGVSLTRMSDTILADYADMNSRMWSMGVLDITFGCVEVDTDEDTDGAYIGAVEADGDLDSDVDQEVVVELP